MRIRVSPKIGSLAFTLVELLTVIAIIAILMALLFPAIGAMKEAARKAQAKNDCNQIVAAVKLFQTEYGKYPTVTTSTTSTAQDDDMVGDPDASMTINNSELFYTLRNMPEGINGTPKPYDKNPRRIVFFEGKAVSNPAQPRGGFLDKVEGGGSSGSGSLSAQKGCYFDPWGKQYNVVMDSDYDGKINVSQKYTDFPHSDSSSDESPRFGAGAFSMGKDNKLGNKGDNKYKNSGQVSDDVLSWQ